MSRPNTPERIALEELVDVVVSHSLYPMGHGVEQARLVLAVNAARNALQVGRVLDGITNDPSIARGHVGSVG